MHITLFPTRPVFWKNPSIPASPSDASAIHLLFENNLLNKVNTLGTFNCTYSRSKLAW